jgi:SnoaL-like domain
MEDDIELRARVQRLDDIEAIKQLRARYMRWLDTQDWESFRNEITEDYHTETDGGVLDGRDTIITSLSERLAGASTSHHCHSPEITLTGPDSATGVWAMQDHVSMTLKGEPFSFRGCGFYHETYVRTPDGWRTRSTALQRLSVTVLSAS